MSEGIAGDRATWRRIVELAANDPVSEDGTAIEDGSYEADVLVGLEDFERTGNPLHLWSVIRRAFRGPEPPHPFFDFPVDRQDAEPIHYPLPHAVMVYFGLVAERFAWLSLGLDWRRRPAPTNDRRANYTAFTKWRDNPTLSPKEAMALVPAALGLVAPGRNAFTATLREARDEDRAVQYLIWRKDGMSPAEAKKRSMVDFGIEDERAWRRAMKRGLLAAGVNSLRDVPQDAETGQS